VEREGKEEVNLDCLVDDVTAWWLGYYYLSELDSVVGEGRDEGNEGIWRHMKGEEKNGAQG
jgi:hypothetical protein